MLNQLSDWDTSKKLAPYKTPVATQGLEGISGLMAMLQQQQQDKALRQATGQMMGGQSVPQGVNAGDLYSKLAVEQNKPNETQQLLDAIGGVSAPLSNATQSPMVGMTGAMPTIPTPQPVANNMPPKDMLLRGIMSKKFGVPYEHMVSTGEARLQDEKDKRTEDLINTVEQNKLNKDMISQAQEATGKIPTGLTGRMKMWWNKMFDPNNPTMGEWQKVKMVLTDAQLMNTAKTKGAISDKEMALFSKAAANDDIASISAMKPVFDKLIRFIDMEETGKKQSYQAIYKQDPANFLGNAGGSNKVGKYTRIE